MGLADFANPMSAVGDVNSKVECLRSEVHRKADSHEVISLRRDMASLERTIDELSSEIHELRSQVEVLLQDARHRGVE